MNFSIHREKATTQITQAGLQSGVHLRNRAFCRSVDAPDVNPKLYDNLKPARLTDLSITGFINRGLSGQRCGDYINDNKNVNRCDTRGRDSCNSRTWKPS